MSRFAPEYDWGSKKRQVRSSDKARRERPRWSDDDRNNFDLELSDSQKLVIFRRQSGVSYFDRQRIDTYHHEPRRAELVKLGVSPARVVEAGMGLSYAEHAAMHYLRYELYGCNEDWAAVLAMTAQMGDMATQRYEDLICEEDLRQWLMSEIVTRRKNWGVR